MARLVAWTASSQKTKPQSRATETNVTDKGIYVRGLFPLVFILKRASLQIGGPCGKSRVAHTKKPSLAIALRSIVPRLCIGCRT